jgi:hypothetical protein
LCVITIVFFFCHMLASDFVNDKMDCELNLYLWEP